MSTKEMAYSILEKFSEEELERFVAYFGIIYPVSDAKEELTEKQKAFQQLESIIRNIPDLDEKKELAEYREEKYGKWKYW